METNSFVASGSSPQSSSTSETTLHDNSAATPAGGLSNHLNAQDTFVSSGSSPSASIHSGIMPHDSARPTTPAAPTQRLKRSKWLTTAYHEASHAVAAIHFDQHFDYIEVNPYNSAKGSMVGDEGADPKVDALIALTAVAFERWLDPSTAGEEGDWEIAIDCGLSLGLIDDYDDDYQKEKTVRRRWLPEAVALFQQHFDDIVTLGEALRKKGRGARMSETECREALAAAGK